MGVLCAVAILLCASGTRPGTFNGWATYYGVEDGFARGDVMFNGTSFDPNDPTITAASWMLPLNSWIQVCSPARCIIVQVRDRGLLDENGVLLDLSRAAYAQLFGGLGGKQWVAVDVIAGANIQAPPKPAPVTTAQDKTSLTLSYPAGWNLISGPALAGLAQIRAPVYTRQLGDSEYQTVQRTLLDLGNADSEGFWVYLPASVTTTLSDFYGSVPSRATVPVGQWLLIGNPSPIEPATVDGADRIYTYDPLNGYLPTSQLGPGQGAWVYSAKGGVVTVTPRPASWPVAVQQALSYLTGKTQAPPLAPRSLPGSSGCCLSDIVTATANGYSIELHQTPAAFPVNDAAINQEQNGAIATRYGTFGVQMYQDAGTAQSAVRSVETVACGKPSSGGSASTPLDLGSNVVGTESVNAQGMHQMFWQDAGWSFTVCGDAGQIAPTARQLASFLSAHPLPGAAGELAAVVGTDGRRTTTLSWPMGRIVASVSVDNDPRRAVALASVMQPYAAAPS